MTAYSRIVETDSTSDHPQPGIQAPVSGMYVPVPAIDDGGGPLSIDTRLYNLPMAYIRITCEVTDAQEASSASLRQAGWWDSRGTISTTLYATAQTPLAWASAFGSLSPMARPSFFSCPGRRFLRK